ncbi:hypothetical protein BST61_g5820 [Cercospora zeina]
MRTSRRRYRVQHRSHAEIVSPGERRGQATVKIPASNLWFSSRGTDARGTGVARRLSARTPPTRLLT